MNLDNTTTITNQYGQTVTLESVWEPQPRQALMISCPIFEVFFGGARGGGKSDAILGEWISHADQWGEDAIGLCVRRERVQLTELIERSKRLYKPLGASFNEQDKMWRFPNGARLRFAYLENDSDAENYQGHNYSRVYVEEMGTFPNPEPIFKLMATLRPTSPKMSADIPRFRATGNPGGPGHLWIKKRYIDNAPFGMEVMDSIFKNPFTGEQVVKKRIFIPSKIQDNKYTNTSEYIGNLYLSGSEQLVKAWLLGDWNVTLGAFFQEWNTTKHVIKTFDVPRHWTRFMSMDMGSAYPFSIGWWCIVPTEFDSYLDKEFYNIHEERVIIPKGSIIRYREWYGSQANHLSPDKQNDAQNLNNKGIKLTCEEIAAGINLRENKEPLNDNGYARIGYRVADPKMFVHDGGPSNAERFACPPYRVNLMRADNKRTGTNGTMGGWDMVRQRLKGDGLNPTMYFMDVCRDAIRTMPALQHDPLHLEDADHEGEDHACDEVRYACMSRPSIIDYNNTDSIRKIFKAKPNTGLLLHDDIMNESKNYTKNSSSSRIY